MLLAKLILIILFLAMIFTLFQALYFMNKDQGSNNNRTVWALTARVGIWVVMIIFLVVGMYTGLFKPRNPFPTQAKPPITQTQPAIK